MRIMILGGDGFCGWPTSLGLSARGHDVMIVDNLVRRKTDIDLGVESLTPITTMEERIATWKRIAEKTISFRNVDIAADYEVLKRTIDEFSPDTIVHFAEQRSAPYSMRSPATKRYTVNNNLNATHNLLCAVVELKKDIHIVHLGTMGVYGYGQAGELPIPEGYLNVTIKQPDGSEVEKEILYPAAPGSVYHTTKTLDALLFYFYNKNDKLRVTDLHQGIVWGTNTKETLMDEALINRFDYDGDYGTVLNRFLMQAALDFPLTVNGTGGQTRAFIHIRDTVRCIELAILNPPQSGNRVEIYNQMTETHRVKDLAEMISRMTGAGIQYLDNPRVEAESNSLVVENQRFLAIGLEPHTLDEHLMAEVKDVAHRYKYRVNLDKIISKPRWR